MGITELRPLVIFGAGGHGASVANVALSAGYAIASFIDESKHGQDYFGYGVLGSIDEIPAPEEFSFAIALGDNAVREKVYESLVAIVPNLHFPPLIHETAVVSFAAEIGEGSLLMPKAVAGPNSTVGRFCILNTGASIDHDSTMHDFSSLAPNAVTGGIVTIGFRTAVSIGSSIKHNVSIGDDSVIGANSYLNEDLPRNTVAFGSPAKFVKTRETGEPYLT